MKGLGMGRNLGQAMTLKREMAPREWIWKKIWHWSVTITGNA